MFLYSFRASSSCIWRILLMSRFCMGCMVFGDRDQSSRISVSSGPMDLDSEVWVMDFRRIVRASTNVSMDSLSNLSSGRTFHARHPSAVPLYNWHKTVFPVSEILITIFFLLLTVQYRSRSPFCTSCFTFFENVLCEMDKRLATSDMLSLRSSFHKYTL